VTKLSPLTLDTKALTDCVLLAVLCAAAIMYATVQTFVPQTESTRIKNAGAQSQSREADFGDNSLVHTKWARVVQDESIACRMYDLPQISESAANASRLPPIDCTKDKFAADPWVWPAGNTFVVTSSKPDVVCEFEGEAHGCHFSSDYVLGYLKRMCCEEGTFIG
jgi:hypothetical protein